MDRLPPSCGEVSATISENSLLMIISLGFVVKSMLTPEPAANLLKANPDSVLLTVSTGVDPVTGSF